MSLSIIVTGKLKDNFRNVASKIESIINGHSEKFHFWLLLGDPPRADLNTEDFALWNDYQSGLKSFPIPIISAVREQTTHDTYSNIELNISDVGNDIFLLPENGVVSLIPSGLKIGIISGHTPNDAEQMTSNNIQFGKDTLDILLTYEWPSGICNNSTIASPGLFTFGSNVLAKALKNISSRYIFAIGEEVYFEREPYEDNINQEESSNCRFISLGNTISDKDEWLYAPSNPENTRPSNCTRDPFNDDILPSSYHNNRRSQCHNCGQDPCICQNHKSKEYICHRCNEPGHHIRDCPKKQRVADNINASPAACWFCLSNPALKKHLIIDIRENVYTALARGGLTREHVLFIPIEHICGDRTPTTFVSQELDLIKSQFKIKMNSIGLEPAYWVLQQNAAHHWHMTSIPVPMKDLEGLGSFCQSFFDKAGYPLTERLPKLDQYFKIGFQDKILYHEIVGNKFFPSQIGRDMMRSFLGLPSGKDWREDLLSESKEKEIAQELKRLLQ